MDMFYGDINNLYQFGCGLRHVWLNVELLSAVNEIRRP